MLFWLKVGPPQLPITSNAARKPLGTELLDLLVKVSTLDPVFFFPVGGGNLARALETKTKYVLSACMFLHAS